MTAKPFTVMVPCSTSNLGPGFDAMGIALGGPDLMVRVRRHAQIKDGATLVLTMGSAPSSWGKTMPPPSMSDVGFQLCPGATNH